MVKIGNYEIKTELLYLDEFTWVERISDGEALIGITDFGQQTLKDITSLGLPSEGQRFAAESEMMSIESISRDYIMKSPASCVILEINNDVAYSPDLINEDPFGNWIVRVEVLDLGDLDYLKDGDEMADQILEVIGSQSSEDEPPLDEDFDYESEFSIDSSDSYYEEDQDNYW